MSPEPRDLPSVDLHGLRPHEALERLARAVHTARVRGEPELLAITGRGWGNARQEPVLRTKVEAWTASDAARRLGVRGFERASKGGALRLRLASASDARET